MTQIIAVIDDGADARLIRRIFENVKGVLSTSITVKSDKPTQIMKLNKSHKTNKEKEEWLNKLNHLYNDIDRSSIDMNDERTRYILSK